MIHGFCSSLLLVGPLTSLRCAHGFVSTQLSLLVLIGTWLMAQGRYHSLKDKDAVGAQEYLEKLIL
uniref:Uncharacterized protein n=1 Tax=Arundo donax TaxID=35708 RepID=A0A0A8YV62_ARUDO